MKGKATDDQGNCMKKGISRKDRQARQGFNSDADLIGHIGFDPQTAEVPAKFPRMGRTSGRCRWGLLS